MLTVGQLYHQFGSAQLSSAVPFWRSHGCRIFCRPLCFLNIWFIPQTRHVPLVSGQSLWASKYEFLEGREWRLCSNISPVPPYCALRDENTGLVEAGSADSTGMSTGCPASHENTRALAFRVSLGLASQRGYLLG